jgi:hypothetical protein
MAEGPSDAELVRRVRDAEGLRCPSFISVSSGPATRWLAGSVPTKGWPRM